MPTDEELMQVAAKGDLNAFEQIVLRHQQTAWAVANRFLNDPAEAEDVAQDSFLKILAAAPRYRPSAAFRTFLIRVVSRLCMDRARKMHPVYTDAPPELPVPDPNTAFLKGRLDMDARGYIRCEHNCCRTSVDGVFACGDAMDPKYRQVATSVGTGCRAGLDCEEFLGQQSLVSLQRVERSFGIDASGLWAYRGNALFFCTSHEKTARCTNR